MKSRIDPTKIAALRRRAEERLRDQPPAASVPSSELESLRLRHELEVAGVELEMQSEELRENQNLLTEVHHRVTNNLQVLTSLLHLEEKRSQHPTTKFVLQKMQARMRSVALLHETLHLSDRTGTIDLAVYIGKIADHLFSSLCDPLGGIRFRADLAPVRIAIDRAIPCGLIVNELVTNSLKHGFPAGGIGEVAIALQPIGGGCLRLRVSDNGAGLPADFDVQQAASLGLQLVSDMAEQLDGRLEIGPGPGAAFVVSFTVERAELKPTE
jgi:two-component sensor histidine kinase